jgi:hypothetical protein
MNHTQPRNPHSVHNLKEQAHQLRRDEMARLFTLTLQYFAKLARDLLLSRRQNIKPRHS